MHVNPRYPERHQGAKERERRRWQQGVLALEAFGVADNPWWQSQASLESAVLARELLRRVEVSEWRKVAD